MATAYHMVQYRRFDADENHLGEQTLEGLCRLALSTPDDAGSSLWERVQDRFFAIPNENENDRQLLLNKVADLSDAVFGELCLVQERDLQALLERTTSKVQLSNITTAEIFALDERLPPQGSQFVRGLAYWLTIGNHLFFVKMQAMTPEYIRAYLSWLLSVRSSVIDATLNFKLRAEFDKSQVPGDVGDIRSLRVTGKATPQLAIVPIPDAEASGGLVRTVRTIADKIVQFEQAILVVEAIFGKPTATSLVESLGANEYLSVDATVKVRGRRTAESRARLRDMANELADTTEAKVQVVGKDGIMSDGDAILRTRMPFELPHEGSSLLEFDNVASQLQEVYVRFVKDGKISAS